MNLFIHIFSHTVARLRLVLCLVLLVTCITASFPNMAAAATIITVNSQTHLADYDPGDGICDGTPLAPDVPPTQDCTVRAAIMEANALPGADIIKVPAGTYNLGKPGPNEDDGATGDLDIKQALVLQGAGRDKTIVDGGSIDRVLHIGFNTTRFAVTVKDLTIQNGKAETDDRDELTGANGGGILIGEANLKLTNVAVIDNEAYYQGGGIAAMNSTFKMTNSVVEGNTALWGGGIKTDNTAITSIATTSVRDNNGGYAGGLYNEGPVTVRQSTFSGNSSEYGAGILAAAKLTMTNSTISGNTGSFGAGIMFLKTALNSSFTHVTIASNKAQHLGGGIITENTQVQPAFRSSIIASNTAEATASDCSGTVRTKGYNLWSEVAGCTRLSDIKATPDLIKVKPLLGPLQNNGGPTMTHSLRADNPIFDAGVPANTCDLTKDQRGGLRPIDGNNDGAAKCDIGASEYNGPVVTTVKLAPLAAGATTRTLTLTGVHFKATSLVRWNGKNLPKPQFVNATTLKVQVPKTVGTFPVQVVTADASLFTGFSNTNQVVVK